MTCPHFDNAIQSQTNNIILCPPRSHKTFVWNTFWFNTVFLRYLNGSFKMGYPVYFHVFNVSVKQYGNVLKCANNVSLFNLLKYSLLKIWK